MYSHKNVVIVGGCVPLNTITSRCCHDLNITVVEKPEQVKEETSLKPKVPLILKYMQSNINELKDGRTLRRERRYKNRKQP